MPEKNYGGNLDRAFLEARGVRIVRHQPWQFGLFHDDLIGKFVWYPMRGTLMYEADAVGKAYGAKVGEFFGTAEVWSVMAARIEHQKGSR